MGNQEVVHGELINKVQNADRLSSSFPLLLPDEKEGPTEAEVRDLSAYYSRVEQTEASEEAPYVHIEKREEFRAKRAEAVASLNVILDAHISQRDPVDLPSVTVTEENPVFVMSEEPSLPSERPNAAISTNLEITRISPSTPADSSEFVQGEQRKLDFPCMSNMNIDPKLISIPSLVGVEKKTATPLVRDDTNTQAIGEPLSEPTNSNQSTPLGMTWKELDVDPNDPAHKDFTIGKSFNESGKDFLQELERAFESPQREAETCHAEKNFE